MLSSGNTYSKPKAESIKNRHQFLLCPGSSTSGQCYSAVTLAFACNSKRPQPRDVVIVKLDLGNTGHFMGCCGDEENGTAEVSWARTVKFLPTTDTYSISSGVVMSVPVNQIIPVHISRITHCFLLVFMMSLTLARKKRKLSHSTVWGSEMGPSGKAYL